MTNDFEAPLYVNIIDKQTGLIIATRKTLKAARSLVDKKDNEYGAYRYSARPVYATSQGAVMR